MDYGGWRIGRRGSSIGLIKGEGYESGTMHRAALGIVPPSWL
jgi:hypothetical protein